MQKILSIFKVKRFEPKHLIIGNLLLILTNNLKLNWIFIIFLSFKADSVGFENHLNG